MLHEQESQTEASGLGWRRVIQGDSPSDRILLPQLALELTLLPHIWEATDAGGVVKMLLESPNQSCLAPYPWEEARSG